MTVSGTNELWQTDSNTVQREMEATDCLWPRVGDAYSNCRCTVYRRTDISGGIWWLLTAVLAWKKSGVFWNGSQHNTTLQRQLTYGGKLLARDALYSAKHGLWSPVRLSVCDVGGLWSHRSEILETNCNISKRVKIEEKLLWMDGLGTRQRSFEQYHSRRSSRPFPTLEVCKPSQNFNWKLQGKECTDRRPVGFWGE